MPVSICVTVPCMYPSARHLIILLLCCLLPVQGALAFARSVGMVSHHARALQTATDTASGALQQHHQGHHQVHHAGHGSVDKSEKSPAKSTTHSQASCTDCAKCCLTGASAPPPAVVRANSMAFVLCAFEPVSIDVAVHIPEKLERPPRAFPPALT